MAESISQATPSQRPPYHHFIPRFLLSNFAVFKNPGRIVPKTSARTKKPAPKPQKLAILDLKSGQFEQGDVADTFGIFDLYRDLDEASRDQYELEKRVSTLENDASKILRTVVQMYDAGKKEVQCLRKDRDLLRRFLFIMMYRNSGFARRFGKSREDYDSDDRQSMLAYMDDKGFQTPKDVWFADIRAFLEVDLTKDPGDLFEDIKQRAYPMDAEWFFAHMQTFFLAFCTPKNAGDEFLLTQNSYSVFEGPSSPGVWTDYHRFAPVSPKIMIVLRSCLLPSTGVGEGEDAKQVLLEKMKSMHIDPSRAGSFLEDLPITRARTNYSRVVNGRVELLPTKMSREKHIFYFPFFPLDHDHVQRINMICLEQASDTMKIVYKSSESLRTALDFYLPDKTPGFKAVYRTAPHNPKYLPLDPQQDGQTSNTRTEDKLLPYLQLLQKVAKQLGSTVKLEYGILDPLEILLVPALKVKQDARYEKLGESSW